MIHPIEFKSNVKHKKIPFVFFTVQNRKCHRKRNKVLSHFFENNIKLHKKFKTHFKY